VDDLRRLSAKMADGVGVDWNASRATATGPVQRVMRALERATRRSQAERESSAMPVRRTWIDRIALLIGWFALLQVVLAFFAATTTPAGGSGAQFPEAYAIATMAICAISGVVLLVFGAGDGAARGLALFHLGIAGAFAVRVGNEPPPWLPAGALDVWHHVFGLPADISLLIGAWLFVVHFPRAETGSALQHLALRLARAVIIIGLALFLLNAWLEIAGRGRGDSFSHVAAWFDRRSPASFYWAVVFVLLFLALPFALQKARICYASTRSQVRLFLVGIGLGLGPLMFFSVASAVSAAAAAFFLRENVFAWATLAVFAGLWTLPITTGVAVLSKGVLALRFVVRRTLQHSLARLTLGMAIVIPTIGAALALLARPDRTIAAFLREGGAVWLLCAGLSGLLATVRAPLLRMIERTFLSGRPDVRNLISAVTSASRKRPNPRDLADALQTLVAAAFRPRKIAVLVVSAQSETLIPIVGRADPLSVDSALVHVLRAGTDALACDGDDDFARLLPEYDRAWCSRQDWSVVVPVHGDANALVAALCLGSRSSDARYSTEDLATLGAVCASVGPLLASKLPAVGTVARETGARLGVECVSCGSMLEPLTQQCVCGGTIEGSVLPRHLAQFTVRRRIGRGGMGVVYEGWDEQLNRAVALKALPELGPVQIEQLRGEARLMAALQHPGLAFILGLQSFEAVPVMVVEYLGGGTLAQRLREGARPIADVLELGLALADALVYLHAHDVLHRDLKPSNVGFTSAGHVKLIDFGIAASGDNVRDAGGTWLYLPPEAFRGEAPSGQLDVWGLSVLLVEAVLGHHPLADLSLAEQLQALERGEIWRHAETRVPADRPQFTRVLKKALAASPGDRFESADAYRTALSACR
jgi:serine/threonine-protein kinase